MSGTLDHRHAGRVRGAHAVLGVPPGPGTPWDPAPRRSAAREIDLRIGLGAGAPGPRLITARIVSEALPVPSLSTACAVREEVATAIGSPELPDGIQQRQGASFSGAGVTAFTAAKWRFQAAKKVSISKVGP